jgi:hypothetical protein
MASKLPAPPETARIGPARPDAVSRRSDSEAQEANKNGKKIIGNYDVKEVNKNYIGFDVDISEDLGSTTTLDKIYLNNFDYSDEKIVNMSLTKIKEEPDKEYLFSIKLGDVTVSDSSINSFLQSVKDDVKTYLVGITTDNKIDFANLYEVTDKKQLPTSLSLKYILFIGNGEIITTIAWNNDSEAVGGDDPSNIKSFKYEKIILISSSTTNFANSTGINKINEINKNILSKEALFCIYFIDFITFTEDMFKILIPNYKEGISGGNKVVKKKRKNKFPKK